MKFFVYTYYLFFILCGGFRHYSFDFIFTAALEGMPAAQIPFIISAAETALMLAAFAALFQPMQKFVHLLFFTILFVMDLYFQNGVKFMSCFILPHFFPIFFFLLLHFENRKVQKELVVYAAMLFVAVGYMSSAVSKGNSAWINWSDTVIYSYVLEFFSGFHVPSLLAGTLVNFKNHLFWKLADYAVILFQLSFVLVFFRKHYFFYITLPAVLFHVCITLILGIGVVFFVYILFYAFVIDAETTQHSEFTAQKKKLIRISMNAAAAILFLMFVFSSFNPRFFNNLLPVSIFIFAEYFYTLLCVFIYFMAYYRWYKFSRETRVKLLTA